MKHNWEYKKLEEVGRINYGTRIVQKNAKGSTYYVYGGGGATFMTDEYNREDCFIVSRFAMSPKCTRYVQGKFFLNDSGLSVESSLDGLKQAFLDKALQANNDKIYSLGKGAAQRNLDINAFKKLIIPLPPLPIQQKIVAELDKVSLIIDKKKQQLKELDNLAQAIFYDMFGDPVENEKGWEVKKLEEIVSETCSISYGIVQPGDGVEEGVPIVRPIDMSETFVYRTGLKQTTKEISDSYKRTILKGDEILLCVRGTTGVVALASPELKECNVTRGITPITCNKQNNRCFIYSQLKMNSVQQYIADYTKGIALKQINMSDVRKIPLIVPPLSLQQSFAAKIEAIEKQKELISRSIKEAQTLFDERMDYWFD